MTAKKKGEKWYVIRKDGSLGSRGYSTQKNALTAQRTARANAAKRSGKPKPRSKSSTSSSNPAGGASTSKTAKLGLLIRRIRTALNITAPGWGVVLQPGARPLEDKLSDAVARYTPYHPQRGTIDWGKPKEAYSGIVVSLANDWIDRKLRNSAKISKGKMFNLLAELIPALRARAEVRAGSRHPLYEGACNYNKRTTGYSPQDGYFILDRVEEYATGKALVAIYDKAVPADWKAAGNRALPQGWNPF